MLRQEHNANGFASSPSHVLKIRRLDDGRVLFGPIEGAGRPCQACVDARLASNGHAAAVIGRAAVADSLAVHAETIMTADTSPVGTMLAWNGRDLTHHLVLPVPGCACGARWAAPSGLDLSTAVDPLVGIVARVDLFACPGLHGEESVLALSRPCRLAPLGSLPGIIDGAGFGTADHARTAAIAETLERYAASFIPAGLRVGAAHELGAEHLAPGNASFAGEPIGWRQPLRWVAGRRLIDDSPCFVQASAVYFPYPCHDLEPSRSRGGSEGLAAGATRHDAVVHATHEVIERDSFVRAWRFGNARRVIASPFAGPYDVRLVAIDNRFGLPVVSAFLESAAPPFCTAGIAARWSPLAAAEVAAKEAIGARALDLQIGRSHPGSLETRHDHARDPALRMVRDRWAADIGTMRGPPPPEDWRALALRLPDAVAVDVTTDDVRALGLTVVRVVIPGCLNSEPVRGESRIGGNPAPSPF